MYVAGVCVYSRTDNWSLCPNEDSAETTVATCHWQADNGRNSFRYNLPYTLYVSAVNDLARVDSPPIRVDTSVIGTCRTIRYDTVYSDIDVR